MKYILFLRILCQESINNIHINDAKILIKEFLTEYGKEFMSINIHSHLHLPEQVSKYGPLNKCSCFPFENMFKMSRDLFHGTVNYESLIANNLQTKKKQ